MLNVVELTRLIFEKQRKHWYSVTRSTLIREMSVTISIDKIFGIQKPIDNSNIDYTMIIFEDASYIYVKGKYEDLLKKIIKKNTNRKIKGTK